MRHSPASVVDRIEVPLLLMHSDNDLRCPVQETEQIFTALAYLGKPVRFVRFEGQSHDLSRNGHPRSREIRLRVISDWLRQQLADTGAGDAIWLQRDAAH
jgi:dipeptidyl aminopeptidase/acylaminoacyl peptidase